MTKDRTFKQAVRAHMDTTGETYMQARAALLGSRTPQLAPSSQLERYVACGYPEALGMSEHAFRDWLAPLVSDDVADTYELGRGGIDALLVIPGVPAEKAMQCTQVRGTPGYVDMNPTTPDTFTTMIDIPTDDAYVVHGFDPGDDLRNQPPSAARQNILAAGRSPITIAEALAAVVLHPQLIADKHAFSIIASRSAAPKVTQSVPAIWISRGAPRLGWCWDNNPHTWLGSASCAGRTSR